MGDTWASTPRLDPRYAVRRLAELTGVELAVEGPCPGGEVGAAYVRWPDGRCSVLTAGTPTAAPLLELARAAGVPVARYELAARVDAATYAVVQELLPGCPPDTVDRPLVEAMLALNGRLAGLLADRSDPLAIPLYLRESGPGFCLHAPLRDYDRRTARLLDWVHDVGSERDSADGDDLVHLDYHLGNILVSAGPTTAITGVVDWDGAGRGDGHLDLVTLRFDLAMRAPTLTDWLDDLLIESIDRERLRAFWAHMSLRLVDWAIRHHTRAEVEFWLDVAELGMRATR